MKRPDDSGLPTERTVADQRAQDFENEFVFVFSEFVLDAANNTLERNGLEVPLRPKSLALLKYLVQRRGQTVSKRALAEAIWPVPPADLDQSIAQCVKDIRAVLGADSRRMLQTVPGAGYAFWGQVEKREVRPLPAVSKRTRVALVPGQVRWWIACILLGLAVAGSVAWRARVSEVTPNKPVNDPQAFEESYRYWPEGSLRHTDTVRTITQDGKTIVCRGGNSKTGTPRQCWWE